MGEDPEIKNIPMPEPPGPGKGLPLVAYFPYHSLRLKRAEYSFGPVVAGMLFIAEYARSGRWIPDKFPEPSPDHQLWTFFPFGIPAQMGLTIIDLIYLVVKGKDSFIS